MMKTRLDCVMLIDDNAFDQRVYRRVIERSGLVGHLVAFQMAEEALAFLVAGQHPPDVIFLDINMPRMNGFEFLTAAQEMLGAGAVPPVVMMLTTSLDPRDRTRAATYAAVRAYINKPLCEQHLGEALHLVNARVAA